MKQSLSLILSVWMILAACQPKKNASAGNEFTNEVYKPHYATGFKIMGGDGQSTVIEVSSPWQKAGSVTMRYFVARGGEKAPDGFDGTVIPAGAKRIVCLSSTYVAMLDAFGEVARVAGVSGINYISNTYVQSHRDSIRDVGAEVNAEVLLALRPDLVLVYGIDDAQTTLTDKLRELHIPYMYVAEYLEESPLGRAEWMVALAEVADCRLKGINAFNHIPQRYDVLKKRVAGVTARPTVMLNAPWNDTWNMPPADSYMVQLIHDAGGEYIYNNEAKKRESVAIGMETAYTLLQKADYWINAGSATTLQELKQANPHFADAKAVKNGRVYNNNRRINAGGGNDFWESSVVRPDKILQDLITIFHPELSVSTSSLYYYRHLE